MQIKPTAPYSHSNGEALPFGIRPIQWRRENKKEEGRLLYRHDHIEILWIRNGNGYLEIDLKKYPVAENMLFCIVPGQVYCLELNEDAEGFRISFPEPLMNCGIDDFGLIYHSRPIHLLVNNPGLLLQSDVACEVDNIIRCLYRELRGGKLFRDEVIKRYISLFFLYLSRQFDGALQAAVKTTNVRLVKNFMALVDKKYITCKMVRQYAGELAVSPNYLNEIVKRSSGYSAGHYIRQRVVLEARRRAAYSGLSMKEIAYQLGFGDVAHFSKFFKSVYGKNFTEFKKESLL